MTVHGLAVLFVCCGGRKAMRVLCAMVIGAALACGQTSTQVFSFSHVTGLQQFQAIANAIRTIAVTGEVSLNADAKSLSVTGTVDQLGLANWLFHDFDVDPQGPRPDTQEYVVPHASDDVVNVFYFNGLQPAQLQELVNMIRVITDIQHIYQNLQANAIAVRGTSAQIAAAAWLGETVTQPATAGKHEYNLPPGADYKGRMGTVLRVFFLTQKQNQQDMQEVVNVLRTITDISKIYQYVNSRAISLRGHPEQIALAEWLVDKLDRPPATENSTASFVASPVYPRDPPAVRVFYLPSAGSPRAIQEQVNAVRAATQITKIYGCPAPRLIALRATDSQAAAAEALFR